MPRTCCELASRFPKLRGAYWDLADGAHDHAFRVQQRRDFASALFPSVGSDSRRLMPESLRHFKLWYGTTTSAFELTRKVFRNSSEYYDWVVDLDPVLCPERTPDHLSLALAALSMQLVSADFSGTIGEEFWSSLAPEEKEGDGGDDDDEQKNDKEDGEDDKAGDGDEGACNRRRPHHQQTPCRLRDLSIVIEPHTPQGILHYRYDPKVDPPHRVDGRWLKNPPDLKMDPAWTTAMGAAMRRVPGMEVVAQGRLSMPSTLLYPDGKGCGAFTRTTRYMDEDVVLRF